MTDLFFKYYNIKISLTVISLFLLSASSLNDARFQAVDISLGKAIKPALPDAHL